MKIGRTDYNQEAIKEMSFDAFKDAYPKLGDPQQVFETITGKKIEKAKRVSRKNIAPELSGDHETGIE